MLVSFHTDFASREGSRGYLNWDRSQENEPKPLKKDSVGFQRSLQHVHISRVVSRRHDQLVMLDSCTWNLVGIHAKFIVYREANERKIRGEFLKVLSHR